MDEMREWNKNLETRIIPTDPNGLFLDCSIIYFSFKYLTVL